PRLAPLPFPTRRSSDLFVHAPLRSKATTIQPLGTSITRDGQVIYQTSGTGAGIGDLYLVAKAVLRDGAPASRDTRIAARVAVNVDRKSTRLNSSHDQIS